MAKDPNVRIDHVLREVAFLREQAAASGLDSFTKDETRSKAVAYSLQIISEAVRNIPEERLAKVPGIAWAKIRGLGNLTRHEYFKLDASILWRTITKDMDELQAAMEALRQSSKTK